MIESLTDFVGVEKLCDDLARRFGIEAEDVVSYACAQFVRRAQDLTIRTAGRKPGTGMASTVAQAKRDYAAYLDLHVRGVRFRKLGDPVLGTQRGRIKPRTILQNRIPKKQVPAYYRKAKALQGRFAAGWNAAALAKKLPVPAWVKRHGVKDGAFVKIKTGVGVTETVTFDADSKSGHGNMEFVKNTALRSVEKELDGKAKFVAANVRRHIRKVTKQ